VVGAIADVFNIEKSVIQDAGSKKSNRKIDSTGNMTCRDRWRFMLMIVGNNEREKKGSLPIPRGCENIGRKVEVKRQSEQDKIYTL
jgi:hypothetical protein